VKQSSKLILLLPFLFLCTLTSYALAEDVSIEASVGKNRLALDDQLILFVTVKGSAANVPNPKLPSLPSFDVYSTGRAQNVSIVNGNMSSSTQFTYVLIPKTPGHTMIPPIEMTIGGKTLSTQPMAIEVDGSAGLAPAAPASSQALPINTREPAQGLILRARVDKKRASVQEQVTLTIQFLRRVRFLTRPSYTPPETIGWMSYDLAPVEYTTTVNGLGYSVTELKYALFPASSGKLTIGPASLQCSVENFEADPFDAFFQNFFQAGQTKTLKTNPITVEVTPLPEVGKPADFSGSVGRFELTGELDKKSVNAGEPVTLTLTVKGEGNIKTIGEPNLALPASFRRYETVTSLNIQNRGDKIAGSKSFKTAIVPEEAGSFSIPPAKFSYFDPSARRCVTLQFRAPPLVVSPGVVVPRGPGLSPPASVGGEIRLLQKDIHYIQSTPSQDVRQESSAVLWALAISNGIPLFLVGGSLWVSARRERELRDPDRARSRKAFSQAEDRLNTALRHLDDPEAGSTLSHLSNALTGYIADRLALSRSGLSLEGTLRQLKARGVSEEILRPLKELWEEMDRGRFAPVALTSGEKKKIYDQTLALLRRLEKQLK
jgi:hypothetical protein